MTRSIVAAVMSGAAFVEALIAFVFAMLSSHWCLPVWGLLTTQPKDERSRLSDDSPPAESRSETKRQTPGGSQVGMQSRFSREVNLETATATVRACGNQDAMPMMRPLDAAANSPRLTHHARLYDSMVSPHVSL